MFSAGARLLVILLLASAVHLPGPDEAVFGGGGQEHGGGSRAGLFARRPPQVEGHQLGLGFEGAEGPDGGIVGPVSLRAPAVPHQDHVPVGGVGAGGPQGADGVRAVPIGGGGEGHGRGHGDTILREADTDEDLTSEVEKGHGVDLKQCGQRVSIKIRKKKVKNPQITK